MNLDNLLEKVAVLGAGGKMGSGISLLLAREMTLQKCKPENKQRTYQLVLLDVNPDSLNGLKAYLKKQAAKYAQKNAEQLRPYYPDASATSPIETHFVDEMFSLLHFSSDLQETKNARMIFEAILEDIAIKTSLYKQLKTLCSPQTFFFSNTSSIPLQHLEQAANLSGRIIGFHFYNPPAVQKLVELIIPKSVHPELPTLSRELNKRLGKVTIPANDIAGFIGNGHFIRDGLYAISEAERLSQTQSPEQAIFSINFITGHFLLRPMGIFQLIDYVGLDIFQSIMGIMNPHFKDENLHSNMIDTLVKSGIKGGQASDGSQKPGFFKYEAGQPVSIYNQHKASYQPLSEESWKEALGPLPACHIPWKQLLKHPDRASQLGKYFESLKIQDTPGAEIARSYLAHSKKIGLHLLNSGAANTIEDINGVLINGFFHLYGPINDY